MAASPKYKIYSATNEYVGSCKYAEDAAVVVGIGYPDGGTVRLGHSRIIWTNGDDADGQAADSYDNAAALMVQRESQFGIPTLYTSGHQS